MKHILAPLYGDQNSQAALILIDAAAADAIRAARQSLRSFAEEHGGTPSLNHIGPYQIHFLSDIPAGFIENVEDIQDVYDSDEPFILTDFDEDAFTAAAETAGFYQRSETTGLKIYAAAIYIIGKEKHGDERIESHEISGSIDTILNPTATA